jgi:hypothetical protein
MRDLTFLRELTLNIFLRSSNNWGSLSLVNIIQELLGRNSRDFGLENRD